MSLPMNHLAGQYIDGVQRCVLCGEILVDDRQMLSQGGNPPKGFPEGSVYKDGNMTASYYEENAPRCNDDGTLPNF